MADENSNVSFDTGGIESAMAKASQLPGTTRKRALAIIKQVE